MSSRFTLDQLPAKYAAQAQAQIQSADQLLTKQPVSPQFSALTDTVIKKSKPDKRIRQNSTGLNKTEQAFLNWLTSEYKYRTVLSQSITLKLANGVRYTPDFVCIVDVALPLSQSAYQVDAFETKGYMRDDAAVKLKVAASLYPWIQFHLVTRKKGEWIIQEILP